MRYVLVYQHDTRETLKAIFMIGSIIYSSILIWKCRASNKEKEVREGTDEIAQNSYDELGDASPLFR